MSKRILLFRKKLMQASQSREEHYPKHEARVQSVPRESNRFEVAQRVIRHDKWAMKDEKLQRVLARV